MGHLLEAARDSKAHEGATGGIIKGFIYGSQGVLTGSRD